MDVNNTSIINVIYINDIINKEIFYYTINMLVII